MSASPEPERTPEAQGPTAAGRLSRSTLLLTNVFKVAGLVVFLNEAVVRSEARTTVLGACILCMAGAQVSEGVLLAIIDRFMGRQS